MEALLPVLLSGAVVFGAAMANDRKKEAFTDVQQTDNFFETEKPPPPLSKATRPPQPRQVYLQPQNEGFANITDLDSFYRGEGSKLNGTDLAAYSRKYNNSRGPTTINGIPMKDYYETYMNQVQDNNTWINPQDLPIQTNQTNIDDLQNNIGSTMVDIQTGYEQQHIRDMIGAPTKRETKSFFRPQERITGYGYQYGGSGQQGPGLDNHRAKVVESNNQTFRYRTNEHPVERVQVGPGLAVNEAIPAAGGFHEFTRILPTNPTDYKANQLPGRMAGGKWAVADAPTATTSVIKNRPDSYYTLCDRGPMPGAGSSGTFKAPHSRENYNEIMKFQNRQTVNAGFGANLNPGLCP